jgi:hypothetical protein
LTEGESYLRGVAFRKILSEMESGEEVASCIGIDPSEPSIISDKVDGEII